MFNFPPKIHFNHMYSLASYADTHWVCHAFLPHERLGVGGGMRDEPKEHPFRRLRSHLLCNRFREQKKTNILDRFTITQHMTLIKQ